MSDVVCWIEQQRSRLLSDLSDWGVILFRGFQLKNAEDFDALIAAFGLDNFPYEKSLSNAVRVKFTDRVFSANEAPADVTIYLHHEMAQTPLYPSKLFFCCVQAPERGGATPVCRSDALFDRLTQEQPEFVRDCEAKGLRYSNVMPPDNDATSSMGRSWKSTLSSPW